MLRRRLAFSAEDSATLFQSGMNQIARATARAEREWLHTAIAELDASDGE